jgi:thiol-disulfide isomerase/thioredoxin
MRRNRTKARLTLALFVTVLFRAVPAPAVSDTYDWFEGATGYEEVFAIAKAGDRPFLLLFAVDWCGYCKRLKKDYLNVSPVEDVVGDHLRVEINPEDGDAERKIANAYGVKGYPTFLVLYPGQETYRVGPFRQSGALTNDEFAEEIRTAVAWSHAKRGAAFWKTREYRASLPFFEHAVKIQPDYEWGHYGQGLSWVRIGTAEKDAESLRRGEASLQKAVEMKPDHTEARQELEAVRRLLANKSAADAGGGH